MEDYKPNSHKSKEEKKVTKVTTGNVQTIKKSGISKFADSFISDDARNIKSFVMLDVLVPALKKAIHDIVTNGIDMILYDGETRAKKTNASTISYRSYYDNKREDRFADNYRTKSTLDYDNIRFESRAEADEVLTCMCDLIDQYGSASVADLFDLAGLSCPHTYNKYGWTALRIAEIARVGGGYVLKLPKAKPIE